MKIKTDDHIEKVEGIDNFIPRPNMILLEELTDNTVKKIGDIEIVFPTHVRWGKVAARNSVRYARVKAVPEKFIVRRATGQYKTRWKTDIEVCAGDTIWVSHTAILNSEKFLCDGKMYFVVDYQSLVVAMGDRITPLNGYVLVKKIEEEQSKVLSVRKKSQKALVKYVGNPVQYMDKRLSHVQLEEGDVILYNPAAIHSLEEKMWQAFPEEIYYIQSKDILAKI